MGRVVAFPVRRCTEVQPKYFSDPDEIIGRWRSYYDGTGKRFSRPTPEKMSDELRRVLSSLLSFAPSRHDDVLSPLSTAIRLLARLALECDLTNERDEKKRRKKEERS